MYLQREPSVNTIQCRYLFSLRTPIIPRRILRRLVGKPIFFPKIDTQLTRLAHNKQNRKEIKFHNGASLVPPMSYHAWSNLFSFVNRPYHLYTTIHWRWLTRICQRKLPASSYSSKRPISHHSHVTSAVWYGCHATDNDQVTSELDYTIR